LNDGNYAAQPNNRLIWNIPSFTVKDDVPDWKVQTSSWNVEDTGKWKTEDTDRFFYEIEEKEKSTSELLQEGMDLQKKLEEENE
jgi:hypothetical protein